MKVERLLHELERGGVIGESHDDLFLESLDVIEVWNDRKVVWFKDGREVEI